MASHLTLHKEQKRRSFFRFFQTEPGRKLVFYGACCTTIGLAVGNFVPHTFLLNQYKDFVQCYKDGVARPVPPVVMERLEKAMDKLELRPYERLIIKPFTVVGLDLFQAGSTKYRFGATIGIPTNYEYSSTDEINRSDILFRNQPIKWNSQSGKLLEEAIVLSEDEQLFGLCKSILQFQTHRVLINSIYPSVSFLTVYTVGRYLNIRSNLFARAMGIRFVLYGILGLFGVGSWLFLKDFSQVAYDADIDKKLSSLGPEFIEAGVRFYDKLLKKNIALRELLGNDTYTAKGNENYYLRQKSMPLTARKLFFESKSKELKETTATEMLE